MELADHRPTIAGRRHSFSLVYRRHPRNRTEKEGRETGAWAGLGLSDKSGRHDPKWDGQAKEALALYARWLSGPLGQSSELARQIARQCEEAAAAGCPDSLVFYVRARFVIIQTGLNRYARDYARGCAAS